MENSICIVVSGGVVTAVHADQDLYVLIRDMDNIAAGEDDPLAEFVIDVDMDEVDWVAAGYPVEAY